MASHIKVDLQIMQDTVSKYDRAKNELHDAITAMHSAVQSVQWTGVAAQTFMDQFGELVTNLKNSDAIMEDAEKDLKQTMDKMSIAEKVATSMGEGLDKGNVALPI